MTLHHITSRYNTLYHVISCYNTLYHVLSRYITLYHVISRYITLYFVISRYSGSLKVYKYKGVWHMEAGVEALIQPTRTSYTRLL